MRIFTGDGLAMAIVVPLAMFASFSTGTPAAVSMDKGKPLTLLSGDDWTTEYAFLGMAEQPVLGIADSDLLKAALEEGDANWVLRVTMLRRIEGQPPVDEESRIIYLIHSPTRLFGACGYAKDRAYRFEVRWRRDARTGEISRSLRARPLWWSLCGELFLSPCLMPILATGTAAIAIAVTFCLRKYWRAKSRIDLR